MDFVTLTTSVTDCHTAILLKENTMDASYIQTFAEILPNIIDFFTALVEYIAPLSSNAA